MNEEQRTEHTASKRVLEQIASKQLRMRPRLYFVLKGIALGALALIVLILSVALGSYILFTLRASHEAPLLNFGPPGYLIFLQLFPWPLLIADIACIVLLEWMLRKFRFGYRSPLLYLLFGILVLVLSATAAIDRTHTSDALLQGAKRGGVPGIGGLYDKGNRPPPPGSGACPCVVEAIDGAILTMQQLGPNPQTVIVILPPSLATSSIAVGDHLFVVGTYSGGVLHAFGIQPMDQETPPPSR